jgi:amino acid transporter
LDSVAIPIATFSYIGVEIVTVTAFEAANPIDLRKPAKNIAYFTMIFYVLNIGGFIANVEWFNQSLPQFFGQPLVSLQSSGLGHTPLFPETILRSSAAPVIATLQVGMKTLPAVLTGLLIYSGLSAANASLYVASRTLYGLTRDLSDDDDRFLFRMAAKLNIISPWTRVPLWSLVVSVLVFSSWLPFIRIHSGYSQADVCPNTSLPFGIRVLLTTKSSSKKLSCQLEVRDAC